MIPVLVTDTVTADLPRAVRFALLWGLEGVVLRTVGGAGDRVPFINEQSARRRLDEAALPVACVDPGLMEGAASSRAAWLNEIDALDDTAAFCTRLGCSVVRVGALAADIEGFDLQAAADALRGLAERAQRSGLRLAVRNEAGTAVASGEELAALLDAVAHPAVGADWHPAEALIAGTSPEEGLAALLKTPGGIACVAVRDIARAGDGWTETIPGEGEVGWAEQLETLVAREYAGPLALDVRARPVGPAGLAAATALIRLSRQASRSR